MNTQATLPTQNKSPNWRNIAAFLGLTFGLTWLLNLGIWAYGFEGNPTTAQLLQLQMLLPAFSAIILGIFVFKRGPIYRETYQERPRWFFYFYLLFTGVYALLAVLALAIPGQAALFSTLSGVFNILGLIVLIAIRLISGTDAFNRAGLSFGRLRDWLIWGLAFVLFYALQTALNAVFNLGHTVDPVELLAGLPGGQSIDIPSNTLRVLLFVQTVLIGPILGLILGFGEEYGWRGYLQGELVKLGKVRGVLLLGVIWGAWHYPIIWMGHNYPGQPVLGTIMMTAYTILLGFVLGHVMLKTGAIWLVAFLHALNNQVIAYYSVSFYQVDNPVFSFGIGLFGLLTMLPIVLLLLRDPIWRDRPDEYDTGAGGGDPQPV